MWTKQNMYGSSRKLMAQSTSELPPFDVGYARIFAHFLTIVFRIHWARLISSPGPLCAF